MDFTELQHLSISGGDDGFGAGVNGTASGLESTVEELGEVTVATEIGLRDLGEIDAEEEGIEFETWYTQHGWEWDLVELAPVIGEGFERERGKNLDLPADLLVRNWSEKGKKKCKSIL